MRDFSADDQTENFALLSAEKIHDFVAVKKRLKENLKPRDVRRMVRKTPNVVGMRIRDSHGTRERLHCVRNFARFARRPRSEEVDRLLGLEIGADDYVAKPFSPREVCARVRTLLRRVKKFSSPSPVIRIGHFELNEPAAQISWFDTPLTLTRYEILLLKTLLKSPGRVWSRQQLMDSVWEDAQDTYDRTVDTHIKTLRAKLRAINPDLSPINTHRGMGYSLRGL